jgi:two-component system sensor histidine kinase UhpB
VEAGSGADASATAAAARRLSERLAQQLNPVIGEAGVASIYAQEVEWTRIARDLHDDTSQQLTGLSIALSALKRRVGATQRDNDLQDDLSSLQHRTIALANNVRHLSHRLHPAALKHAGLYAALPVHCAELGREHEMVVTLDVDGEFESLDQLTSLCLYRVAQEALRNIVTHAGASHAEVQLPHRGHVVALTIDDDGSGFDPMQAGHGCVGLISMHERVRLLGGSVSVVSEMHKGTRGSFRFPQTGARRRRARKDAAAI